jgi:lysophospholipase L1-like esterase
MPKLCIAALGSSFASGHGIDPIVDNLASRSGRNYAHILAETLNAELMDLSSSGATLENILNVPQSVLWGSLPPQLENLPPDTDIVTVTAGGNDLGYGSGMISDSVAALTGPARVAFEISESYEAIDIPTLQARLTAVIDKIKTTAPKATIYLVEYLNVFGACTRPELDTPLNKQRLEWYMRQGQNMSVVYRQVAEGCDRVEVIPMSELSKGHEVGSETPWITAFDMLQMMQGKAVPYHPNAAGHQAAAEALFERISQNHK